MTAGMLHDIANVNGGSDNHAADGAVQAEVLLKSMKLYSDDEIAIITTAIARHDAKSATHEAYDELLKDADVLSHCFYNPDFPVNEWERKRYQNLLLELGCTHDK